MPRQEWKQVLRRYPWPLAQPLQRCLGLARQAGFGRSLDQCLQHLARVGRIQVFQRLEGAEQAQALAE